MMDERFDDDAAMGRALELARRGVGHVEPNPMVGAIVVDSEGRLLGEGYHQNFGGPHAEVHALAQAGSSAAGQTLYVTLEPCCHIGKTPPCTEAVIAAGIRRVVIGMTDPFPAVAGNGINQLRAAGITVDVGIREAEARRLTAPFRKLTQTGLPYVHAKWAMTLDGKIATHTGSSRWITNAESRALVHRLRGRMDAVIIGHGTALADDPLLTARPIGPRVATRIILDTRAELAIDSQLVRTIDEAPVLVVAGLSAPEENVQRLTTARVEVLRLPSDENAITPDRPGILGLLRTLGERRMTNILVEGGGHLLGAFRDTNAIDEVHVFIAPKVVGGATAPSPVAGGGHADMPTLELLEDVEFQQLAGDLYVHGFSPAGN